MRLEVGTQGSEDRTWLSRVDNMSRDQLGVGSVEYISHADLEPHRAPLRRPAHVSEPIGPEQHAWLIEWRVWTDPVAGQSHAPPGAHRRDLQRGPADVLRRVVNA